MSTISNFYTQLNTTLATLYPNHKKMVDPQNVEKNDNFILNKGYGFYIGAGTNTQRLINCKFSFERECTIVLSRVNRGTERDITIRETAEKAILEDQFLLIQNIESDVDLNSIVASFKFVSDNGIEYLNVDEQNFIVSRTVFQMEYFESLT